MNKKEFIGKVAFNILQIVRKYNNESDIETWSNLKEERKTQVLKTVEAVFNNPEITAKEMHSAWVEAKVLYGWQYAPITDISKKLHSCLVNFEDLHIFQQMKDDIFIETVKQLLELDYDNFNIEVLRKSNQAFRSTNDTLEITNKILSGNNDSLRKNNRILLGERIEYMELTENQRKMIIQLENEIKSLKNERRMKNNE
jgi:hypothetical protein